jgi:hypothetical protein
MDLGYTSSEVHSVTCYCLPHPRMQKYIQMVHRSNAHEETGYYEWTLNTKALHKAAQCIEGDRGLE